MTAVPAQGVRKATRREWLGLLAIALPCMIYSMDLTVLNLAVPTLTRDLKPSASQLLWIIDIYGFMVAGFLMTMGTLGDRIGRRRLLMIGAAFFGVASTVATFSDSAEMLIAMRAVLGIAGATLAPSTLSLITVMFTDEKERTFAISMWIASFSVGAIFGPVVGGFLIEYFWWGSAFLIAVPPMLLLLVIGPILLPEYRAPEAGRIDLLSALLSLASVLALIYGIKHWAADGFDWQAAAAILVGLGFVLVFLRRQARLADPMVDLAMFRIPAFRAALAINLAGILFMFGSFIFLAQYFQLVAGLTPLQAGLWSLPSAIAFTLASFVTPALVGRYRPATLMAGGMVISALGFAWLVFAPSLVQVVAASVFFSIGFTPVITLTTGIVVGSAPPERTGAASAMSETSAELGGALGVAVLGSLGAALYRSRMADVAVPGISAEALAPARSTLGGALAFATELAPDQAGPMLARASEAFMLGFRAAAILSIVGMLFCIAVTLTTLRDARTGEAH
ncbi:MFS transporter, DHA2 family, multidrug resistance protein OS=Bosea thiooxidans OX=53254 GN=SAMN05660750_00543 PE=4 SV=1 [Bosea thiooxidans]|uniref:MFS transporter, DHA2 family, multidrug resistance protein n=1 Tax=Bosea thiooxidans TaxID=53254 RepID=A0A1T5AWW2_9HYPH|nr:MFS transporter [Bosea thiooxidans]SKB39478.1 MFS transporter, DHA2 family, multidrug resistance protein [Bosea thiooxidans]